MQQYSKNVLRGFKDGIPIGLGYFAVSFSLGIAAHNAGISAIQGFFMSLLNNASAGEYAGIAAIKANAPYFEIAMLILIANARYLLMSCALSQKLPPELPIWHRMLIGFDITDELFGIAIAHPYPLVPEYMYGAFVPALSMWAGGTALGIIAGEVLSPLIVTSLSAAIYGMFIAIIVPPGRKNKTILWIIIISFVVSSVFALLPWLSTLSESFRIIILTLLISSAAAILRPVSEEGEGES